MRLQVFLAVILLCFTLSLDGTGDESTALFDTLEDFKNEDGTNDEAATILETLKDNTEAEGTFNQLTANAAQLHESDDVTNSLGRGTSEDLVEDPSAPECFNYNFLNESNRAITYNKNSPLICDSGLSGWYRFGGAAGNQMPESCVDKRHCGTHAPGWLNGSHPSVADGVVQRKVCFHWSSGCCHWSTNIDVRNCGQFYVYKLHGTPACTLRYCGNGVQSAPECSNYNLLDESNRAITYNKSSPLICDNGLSGWYRFGGAAGNQMPETCVDKRHCGTHAPGWLNGRHPSVADGAVRRKVCFHWSSDCCQWSTIIDVRNCGQFYVYKLQGTPACTLRYCGNGVQSAPECSNYKILSESDRAQGYKGVVKCDQSLDKNWYRIQGDAGKQMPNICVPTHRCGTHAPGWLNGNHPSVADGAVSRKVCFHWTSGCCQWSTNIRVRNCGGFYVYELSKPPACSLRYCGDRKQAATTPRPTTTPTPTSSGQECFYYNLLNEYNRAITYNKSSPLICDSGLSGWYRFGGAAGNQMPEFCVDKLHCGTHAPGWLNGRHPSVADGAVQRKVCFHWSSGCCQWSTYITVRNCGRFYVYKLHRPPACTLRYCGNGLAPTTVLPTPTPTVRPSPTSASHGFVLVCLPTAMVVKIKRDSLPSQVDPSLLHLNDPECGALAVNEENIVMKTPLNGCGTIRRSIGNKVSFHNNVVVPSGVGKKRTLQQYQFECNYIKFGHFPGVGMKPKPLYKRGQVMDSAIDDGTM